MKNCISYILPLLLMLICSASCDSVHEFPEEEERPDVEFKNMEIIITPVIKDITVDVEGEISVQTDFPQIFSDDDNLRLVCEFWSLTTNEIVKTDIFPLGKAKSNDKFSFKTDLKLDKYRIVIWRDHASKSTPDTGKYWNTTDGLKEILLNDIHAGNTDEMDCCFGSTEIDLTPYKGKKSAIIEIPVNISRPVGKFVLVANDIKKQVEQILQGKTAQSSAEDALEAISHYKARIYYQGYNLYGFNAHDGTANDATSGMSFLGNFKLLNDEEAQMAFSYQLAQNEGSTIHLAIQIIDEKGQTINEIPELDVEIERGKLTVVRFDFLTHKYENGISIDQGFEGEYDINLPD